MRYSIPLLLVFLASGAGGCASLSFLPADAMATLRQPNHVDAFRTGTLIDHPGYGGKMDGFAVFQTGEMQPDLSRQLADAVADPSTYRDTTRYNEFTPTTGYRFYYRARGGQISLDVLIGFDCDEILLVAHDARQQENFRRLMEIDPGRPRLLEITRQVFPNDQAIQSLPDSHTPPPSQ